LQQDAVINLCESLKIPATIDNYPKLKEIREIRNESIGHPTKRNRGKGQTISSNFISRLSLSFGGFELYSSYSNGKSDKKNVSIPKLIADQRKYISDILTSMILKLKEEEMNHKMKYRNEKLVSIFSSTLDYHFEKVFESIFKSKPASFGEINLQQIDKTLDAFREALEKRGIELETYDSINYVYELIDYPLNELKDFFHNLKSGMETNINEKTAYIFTFFLNKQVSELRQMAQEIDEEYSE
jgi:transcription termination factor NusB